MESVEQHERQPAATGFDGQARAVGGNGVCGHVEFLRREMRRGEARGIYCYRYIDRFITETDRTAFPRLTRAVR